MYGGLEYVTIRVIPEVELPLICEVLGMLSMHKLKGLVNKNKNRNLRFVVVRENRVCKYCNKLIKKGSECITINKRYEGRQWVCSDCLGKIMNYQEAKAEADLFPFDDEGGYMAHQDYLAECEAECERIGYFDFED